MESEINNFAKTIRDNTGIVFDVYAETGECLVGEDGGDLPSEFDGLFYDKDKSRTLFKFRHKNRNYIGSIAGINSASKNYAYLIAELAEQSYSKVNLSKEEFYKSAILGEASFYTIKKYAKKYAKESKMCVMLVTFESGKQDEVETVVKGYAEGSADFYCNLDEGQAVYIKFIDDSDPEYRSVTEYAEFLAQSVYDETGIEISVFIGGTVDKLADISTSFSQALSAHRISESIDQRAGVHSFKEYILVKILEDLPKYKLADYLGMLMDSSAREIFEDKDMVDTAETFLENGFNVSETARKLYLHRNTLNYRLDKIEKSTGLNIRKISDAITFKMITVLIKTIM